MPKKVAKVTTFAILLLGISALLSSCREMMPSSKAQAQLPPLYQIFISHAGQVYRLNASSGEVVLLENIPTLNNGTVKLVVGSYYEAEDGKALHYVGNHKFELRPSLDEIFKTSRQK